MTSHELRHPLTNIKGQAQLMKRRERYSERAVDAIVEQTERLGRLIDDLLLASLIEADRFGIRREPVDLVREVRMAVEQLQSAEHPIVTETEIDSVLVLGDRQRLGQVLSNLLSNAIKYSPDGRGITIRIRPDEATVHVDVVDQGVGILVWSPMAGGLLSGKYRRGRQPAEGRHLTDWGEPPVRDEAKLHDIIDALVEIAEGRGVSAAQVALAWLLGRPGVTSLVVGARNEDQLRDNIAAASLVLGEDERARLDQVSAPPLIYPYWHQASTAGDRLSAADLTLLQPHLSRRL